MQHPCNIGIPTTIWYLSHCLITKAHASLRMNERRHELSNNVACATSKVSDQPAHERSLIRAFVSRLNTLCRNATLLEITCRGSLIWIWSLKASFICTIYTPVQIFTRGVNLHLGCILVM